MLRKRFRCIVFILLLLPALSISQGFQNVVIESVDEVCFGKQSQGADAEAEAIVDEIMAQMGLKRNFKIRRCANIENAVAHIEEDENGNLTPYILYDPNWLAQMSKKSKTDWASIGVLAHEVGHFLLYHSINKGGSKPRWELSADQYAGSTLARMGSTLEQAQSMFLNVSEKGSSTHPGRAERMEAIRIGWMKINNPTQKKILLNEDTPERDVNEELIVNRYFKVLGGIKELSAIKELKFEEEITETKGKDLNQKPYIYNYSYEQSPNRILITSKERAEEYLILNNDSLLWKYTDQKKWKVGAPPVGTGRKTDAHRFMREKVPVTKNFFDDFVLVSNPELATYLRRKRLGGEECFVITLPEESLDIGDLRKKGKRITVSKEYYFSTATGLLFGIVEREKITPYIRGKIKNPRTLKTEHLITAYSTISGVQFPSEISSSETELINDIPQEDKTIYQKRSISEITFHTEVSQEN